MALSSRRAATLVAHHGHAGLGSTGKSTFHCSKGYRLVTADHLGLLVARRKGNKNGCDQRDERSRVQ